jgi:oligopeptide/dipeptide ABC transporter ATP-binding protein
MFSPMPTVLEVRDLRVGYQDSRANITPALEGVSFVLRAGEILGVLGESGCGKSTLASSLLRLLAQGGHLTGGSVQFEGREIFNESESELRRIRGARMALIFQEASLALHPTMRVGEQVANVIAAHSTSDRRARLDAARKVLEEVFSSDTERIFSSYPHQLSGGQRQRVLIAQAIACNPAILIADEPTASLDTTTQAEILSLFAKLRQRHGMAIILITHNPAILAQLADRILVLYAGRVVEEGSASELLGSPRHPYVQALFRAMADSPEQALALHGKKLPAIQGRAPDLSARIVGCAFEPRCGERMEQCVQREPMIVTTEENHSVACFKYGG